jgi:hypothetical protein
MDNMKHRMATVTTEDAVEETGKLSGMFVRETFTLVNPEADIGKLRPQDHGPRTVDIFGGTNGYCEKLS